MLSSKAQSSLRTQHTDADAVRVMSSTRLRFTPCAFRPAIRLLLWALWNGLREACGDIAYERYLNSKGIRQSALPILTPAEFYVEQTNRRYSRPNRCC
jgi:uncharacterized short protein YbdD (DUF466 family)